MKRLLRAAPPLLFCVGAMLLVRAAWQAAYSPSMDYAVVVEMARDMASGANYPTFFYGQSYMGSFEPAASAILCALFGPHPFWVCMGSALFGIATLFFVMRMARRLGGNAASAIALAFAICGGAYWVHFMVSPRGGYALATLLCLLALHFGTIAEFIDGATGRVRIAPSAILGLTAGLAFWNFWLALPAFVVAGAALLMRLRLKTLSPRLLLPAAVAFLVGSSPWWIFAIRHGLGAFASSGPLPPGIHGLADIVEIVAIRFYGVAANAPAFWRSPFPWVLIAIAAFTAVDAAIGGSRDRRRFFLATALYALLFLMAYCATSFGSLKVARYFVPFVPTFAVAGGSAIGAALRHFAQRPRHIAMPCAAAILLAAYATLVAPASIRASEDLMDGLRRKGDAWAQLMTAAAEDPTLAQPAFADFRLFGANWVTDRRLCFSSPLCWRYEPFLLRLEKADAPVVIDDSQAFGQFCHSTQGRCQTHANAGLSVTADISPPPELHELPADAISKIVLANAADATAALVDDNLATAAQITSSASSLDITLKETQTLSGVTAIVTHTLLLRGWRAEALDGDGNPIATLSSCNPIGGWFWSGPRPFMFGPDHRLELRWTKQPLSRIRITFDSAAPALAENGMEVTVADLRLLSDAPLPPCDVGAVSTAVQSALSGLPGARIHAGRWLGGKLGAEPDPALKFGRGASLAIDEVCRVATLDLERGAIVVLRGDAADAAEATLSTLRLEHSRVDSGGCSVFAIRPISAGHPIMRFFGGRLHRDCPPENAAANDMPRADFGGDWRIESISPLPASLSPGDTLHLELSISRCGQNPFPLLALFVHGVRDGARIFDGGASVNCTKALIPADAPMPLTIKLDVAIPRDMTPGPANIELCAKRIGGKLRLRPANANAPTDRRRLVLGKIQIQ